MTKSTSSPLLKRTALIAAIGTTGYTLFESVFRMVVGDRWWLYFDDHLLYNNVWHIFFSSVLIVSCVVFALGVLCDGKHFPILGKGIWYVLLGIAIVSCSIILCFALSDNKRIMDAVPWLYLLFLLETDAVLWYIYIHTTEDIQPNRSRWLKSICRTTILLALSVLVKQIPSVIWYVWKCTQFPEIAHESMFRNILGRLDWLCNGLILCVSIVFFLLVVLQPLITRRAQCINLCSAKQQNNNLI